MAFISLYIAAEHVVELNWLGIFGAASRDSFGLTMLSSTTNDMQVVIHRLWLSAHLCTVYTRRLLCEPRTFPLERFGALSADTAIFQR